MPRWSDWLTDPNFYGSSLPDGATYWYGLRTLDTALDAEGFAYRQPAFPGDLIFDEIIEVEDVTTQTAACLTFGIDLSWLADLDTAEPPRWNSGLVPSLLRPQWDGTHQFESTHGIIYEPFGATISIGLVQGGGPDNTATHNILMWVDDDVSWSGGPLRMHAPAYDPSTRAAKWAAAIAHVSAPGSGVPLAEVMHVPVAYIAAAGYRISVTVAVDSDVPSFGGHEDYLAQHDRGLLASITYQNPRYRIGLATPVFVNAVSARPGARLAPAIPMRPIGGP